MPHPAKKKRKTEARPRRNEGQFKHPPSNNASSQEPNLSVELIGKVASFAGYGADTMNICLAVGPKQAHIIRQTCLRHNIGYLDHLIMRSRELDISPFELGKFINPHALAWLEVNKSDWRKLCTARDMEEHREVVQSDPEGDRVVEIRHPLAMFNNPLVAIDFGLVDVLKHLVEEVGIDINGCKWTGYESYEKINLLAYASRLSDTSCFEYLLTRNDVNVHARYVAASEQERANDDESDDEEDDSKQRSVFEYIYDSENISLGAFEAIIRHSSFKPNEPMDLIGTIVMRPLQYACMSISADLEESDPDKKFEKLLSLIKKTDVDPTLRTEEVPDPYSLTMKVLIEAAFASMGEDGKEEKESDAPPPVHESWYDVEHEIRKKIPKGWRHPPWTTGT